MRGLSEEDIKRIIRSSNLDNEHKEIAARWLYMTMYNDELIKVAREIRGEETPTIRAIGMIDTLTTLDLLK